MATLKNKIALVTAVALVAPGTLALAASAQASAPTSPTATVVAAGIEEKPGPLAYSYIWNAFTLQYDIYTGSSVGYEAADDGTYPRVGDVFYATMMTGVISQSSAPIMGLAFDEALAPDVTVAISAANPVKCYYRPTFDAPWQEDAANCSQTGTPAPNGGLSYGGRGMVAGEAFKVKVPITVSKTKSGDGSGNAAKIYQYASDVNMSTGYVRAEQTIYVYPAASGGGGSSAGGTAGTMTVGQKLKLPKKQKIKGKKKKVYYKAKSKKICKLTNKGKKVKAKKVGTCKLKAKPKKGKGKKIVRYTVTA